MSERRFVQLGDGGYIYEIPNCDLSGSSFRNDDFTIKSHLIDHVDDLKKYCPRNVLIAPVNILVIVEADKCHYVKIDDFRFAKLTNKMLLSLINLDFFFKHLIHLLDMKNLFRKHLTQAFSIRLIQLL